MHKIEEVIVEINHLKEKIEEQSKAFEKHTDEEKLQFRTLSSQHNDLIKHIGDLTVSIEVYVKETSVSMTWFKRIGGLFFTGLGMASAYLFFELRAIELKNTLHDKQVNARIEKIEKRVQHIVDKDVYYDSNRDTIYEMIEGYKAKRKAK